MNIGALLESPAIVNTVLSILGLATSWLVARILRDRVMSEQRRVAYDALAAGVQLEWEVSVRDLKQLSEDGKLTAEERQTALSRAMKAAIGIAYKQGVDLLKVVAAEEVPALIHRIIAARKNGDM